MVFDEVLGDRVRDVLSERDDVTERRMFGGLAFMVAGNMCCGVIGEELMVRVGPDAHDDAVAAPNAHEMEFTNRPMSGMVMVSPEGLRGDEDVRAWVQRGLAFVRTLPPK